MRINDLTYAHGIGFFDNNRREVHDHNKVSKEIEQENMIKKLKEENKKVQPVYNLNGQLIEYDKHGRHLNRYA